MIEIEIISLQFSKITTHTKKVSHYCIEVHCVYKFSYQKDVFLLFLKLKL